MSLNFADDPTFHYYKPSTQFYTFNLHSNGLLPTIKTYNNVLINNQAQTSKLHLSQLNVHTHFDIIQNDFQHDLSPLQTDASPQMTEVTRETTCFCETGSPK